MKHVYRTILILTACVIVMALSLIFLKSEYSRPYQEIVCRSGLEPALVYAIMKAESNFNENAVSKSGAVGLMQLMPSTAEFICRKQGLVFHGEKLFDGAYNVMIGCMYMTYLLNRFSDERTAICAYNAGEGTVSDWLQNPQYSSDGLTLHTIPYTETRNYEKKVCNFRKNYQFLYQ
mgnify:CR=1 FL=1